MRYQISYLKGQIAAAKKKGQHLFAMGIYNPSNGDRIEYTGWADEELLKDLQSLMKKHIDKDK